MYFDFSVLLSILKRNLFYIERFPYKLLILIPAIILLNFAIRNTLLFFGIDYIKSVFV